MEQKLRSFKNVNFENKVVFLRMDYNVKIQNNVILDNFKIDASFSTILDTYNKNPRQIIIGTHLGRPNGEYVQDLSCRPIYEVIKSMIKNKLNENIYFSDDLKIKDDKFVFIENLRFFPEEENDSLKSGCLISLFKDNVDIIVNDAFGVLHRDCFTTTNKILPIFAGNLVQKEFDIGYEIVNEGVDLIILGGCKIKDKIKILETLISNCKAVFIVGAIACTFLKYRYNKEMGISKIEKDAKEDVQIIFDLAKQHSVEIYLTQDFYINQNKKNFFGTEIPDDGQVFDIGLQTIQKLNEVCKSYKNIFWNGPPGKFEEEEFSNGSRKLVEILSKHDGKVVVGGGETSACVCKYSLVKKFYHVSTGGGSFLKLLSKNKLPGLEKLKDEN